jgi:hypothetical protein
MTETTNWAELIRRAGPGIWRCPQCGRSWTDLGIRIADGIEWEGCTGSPLFEPDQEPPHD